MKRWPLRILLCLILLTGGAITTVAVAYLCQAMSWGVVGGPVWYRVYDQAGQVSFRLTGMTTVSGGWPLHSVYGIAGLRPKPIWPGFVIDTLFYAAIWFGLFHGVFFGVASAKQAIRRARGRCPMCGYDLRGALEKGCSECGWNRGESAA